MAHVAPHEALLWAGAGIVAASDPAAEWDETEWKLGAMRDVLPSSDAQAVR
jgi:isochorismate synthase